MDNRRPTDNTAPKPYTRGKYFERKQGDSSGQRNFQPRDNGFIKRDNNYRGGDNRFQNRDGRSPVRDDRNQNRDDRNQNRDDRSRDNRFQSRNDRFQSRDNRNNDRFQSRDNRDNRNPRGNGKYPPRDNRFQDKNRFFNKGKGVKPWQKEQQIRIVSDMQVTDGKHRGKYLQSTTSPKVRPTARRLREIMFKILFRKIRARRFLDLCAGCGTVGLEAMSRGALLGTFVERSAKMCSFIKKNMEACGIKEGHGEVLEMECVPFLKQMMKRKRFWDVVYYDPPYDVNYDEVLDYFAKGAAVAPDGGILVIEHHAEMFFPERIGSLKRWRVIVQGDSALSFFERK
jgi:16S rRNA (guanine966-N2)-methyltransferase